MLRKAKRVRAGDFAATLFFGDCDSAARAGVAADPVAIVHCSKLAKLCESQNGAPRRYEKAGALKPSACANQRAPEIRRAFVYYGGTRRASRWLRPGRVAFPRRASACRDAALR